jgi:DNA-binding NarL/FixJ family response regulator
VLIADPHPGIRTALRNALQDAAMVKIVGEALDVPSAIDAVSADQVDVVLAGSRLAGLGSESARAGLEQLSRRIPVIVMGMNDPRVYTAPLQAAGAAGYWPKDGDLTQLTGLLSTAAHQYPRTRRVSVMKHSLIPT